MGLKAIAVFGLGLASGCLLTRQLTHQPPPAECPAAPAAIRAREKPKQPASVLAGGVALPQRRAPDRAVTRQRAEAVPNQFDQELCPGTASEYHQAHPDEDRLTCRCTAGAAGFGNVWGSGIYTTDSSICKAARHDGLLGQSAREVTLYFRPGLSHYEGSESNGVRSDDYGRWESSYSFSP